MKKTSIQQNYENMPTAELERLLQEELKHESPDVVTVHQLLCALKDRRPVDAKMTPEIEAVLDKYQKRKAAQAAEPAPKKGLPIWLTKAVVVAAVLCLLITAVPVAFGAENIVELVGRWTEDFFQLVNPDKPVTEPQEEYVFRTDNPGLRQFYDAVTELGATEPMVPMWLPEECSFKELKIYSTADSIVASVSFVNADEYISITVRRYAETENRTHTKTANDVLIYEHGEIVHYIVQNRNNTEAAWTVDGYACSIATSFSYDILYKMLESIYGEA